MARRWASFFFFILLSCILSRTPPCFTDKQAVHDGLNPTMPITVPYTNPAPTIITVPSTNPTITIPSLNPLPTPITAPSMVNPSNSPAPVTYPLPTPSTSAPMAPVSTPSTFPPSAPLTNPTSNSMTPPALTTTPPTAPVVSGQQVWCVAKAGSAETALQNALDYACGIGGADCSAIQPAGNCYYPNTLDAHASYAFNSYYQRTPTPSSCDFGGTAMLVNVNPSSGSCVLASSVSSTTSSSVAGYNPVLTTPTTSSTSPITPTPSGSGSSVLNPGGSDSCSSEFGSDIPDTSNCWRSISPHLWSLVVAFFSMLALPCIKGTILETE